MKLFATMHEKKKKKEVILFAHKGSKERDEKAWWEEKCLPGTKVRLFNTTTRKLSEVGEVVEAPETLNGELMVTVQIGSIQYVVSPHELEVYERSNDDR